MNKLNLNKLSMNKLNNFKAVIGFPCLISMFNMKEPASNIAWTLSLAMLATGTSHAANYAVTEGAFNGTVYAAKTALEERSCSGLDWQKLTALSLSIAVWEGAGGSGSTAVSPMILSRWDTWSGRSDGTNHYLYSFDNYDDDKRAHWNPGVGLWQLDTWADTIALNHRERALTSVGGLAVTRYLRDSYCGGTDNLKRRLAGNWFACKDNTCYNTYIDMYNNGNLNVSLESGADWDGGVTARRCRYGSTGTSFSCYWFNENNSQGFMDKNDVDGVGARTPLAAAFLTFTYGNTKRAIWLQSSGLGKEIRKTVPRNGSGRESGDWAEGTSLQVFQNGYWSTWGINEPNNTSVRPVKKRERCGFWQSCGFTLSR